MNRFIRCSKLNDSNKNSNYKMSFICDICGTKFSYPYNLKQHKKRAKYCMAKAENLQCIYCNQVSADPNHLDECIYYKNYKLKLDLDNTTTKLKSLQKKCAIQEQKQKNYN